VRSAASAENKEAGARESAKGRAHSGAVDADIGSDDLELISASGTGSRHAHACCAAAQQMPAQQDAVTHV